MCALGVGGWGGWGGGGSAICPSELLIVFGKEVEISREGGARARRSHAQSPTWTPPATGFPPSRLLWICLSSPPLAPSSTPPLCSFSPPSAFHPLPPALSLIHFSFHTLLVSLIVLYLFLHPPTLLTNIAERISLSLSLLISLQLSLSLPPSLLLHHHLFTHTHYRSIHHLCREKERFSPFFFSLLLIFSISTPLFQLFRSLWMQF